MKRKSWVIAAAAAVAITALAGCTASGAEGGSDDGPIKVGVVLPLTGPYAILGGPGSAAMELMAEQINSEGGIDGRQIELTFKDDTTDVTQSVTEYNQLAASGEYDVLVSSSFVSASAAISESATAAQIPTLSLGPVSAYGDGSNEWIFVVPATAEIYGQAMVEYFTAIGVEKLAIGYTGGDVFGTGGSESTVQYADEAGLEIVLNEPFDQAATDFTPLITKALDSGADAFLVWGAGPAPGIITGQFAAQGAGSGVQLYMTGAQASTLYSIPVGEAGEGVILSSNLAVAGADIPAGSLKTQIDDFAALWAASDSAADYPYPPQFAFEGAAAIQLIKAAIEAAGSTDHAAVRDALEGLDILTTIGRKAYSPTDHVGLTTADLAIVEIQDGAFVATEYSIERFADLPN
ncbi:ABC transporter substrate-binding protein [Pseudolysinimonas yzui]|uniref:ABC transporter substrate-binding protein n=1 Tax=Pseudolysinimonas yzui TaxID=2708254 RepID=UPI00174D8925|nr:ABC transporter substrate-binding protein [Pseudolysinimonas yzui]